MSEDAREKLPEGAIVVSEVQAIGYIEPDGTGEMKLCVWYDGEVPLTSALGMLDLAKRDLILHCEAMEDGET